MRGRQGRNFIGQSGLETGAGGDHAYLHFSFRPNDL
jgi:hypothetical protein